MELNSLRTLTSFQLDLVADLGPSFSCSCLTANMHQILGCLSTMQGAPRIKKACIPGLQTFCNTVEMSTHIAPQHEEGVSDSTTDNLLTANKPARAF